MVVTTLVVEQLSYWTWFHNHGKSCQISTVNEIAMSLVQLRTGSSIMVALILKVRLKNFAWILGAKTEMVEKRWNGKNFTLKASVRALIELCWSLLILWNSLFCIIQNQREILLPVLFTIFKVTRSFKKRKSIAFLLIRECAKKTSTTLTRLMETSISSQNIIAMKTTLVCITFRSSNLLNPAPRNYS